MRLTVRRLVWIFCGLFITEQVTLSAWAAAHRIEQLNRAFNVAQIEIHAGDTLQFTNDDPFLHQIYVKSPTLNFESDEQPPRETVELKFPNPGVYEVRCHIHPKMLLTVTVK